jgi:hypothetical protein
MDADEGPQPSRPARGVHAGPGGMPPAGAAHRACVPAGCDRRSGTARQRSGLVSEVPHPGGGLAVGGRTDRTVD